MSNEDKKYLQDYIIGWKRADSWDAFQNFLRAFAVANIILVSFGVILLELISFMAAFWIAITLATTFALASLLFKIIPVFEE